MIGPYVKAPYAGAFFVYHSVIKKLELNQYCLYSTQTNYGND